MRTSWLAHKRPASLSQVFGQGDGLGGGGDAAHGLACYLLWACVSCRLELPEIRCQRAKFLAEFLCPLCVIDGRSNLATVTNYPGVEQQATVFLNGKTPLMIVVMLISGGASTPYAAGYVLVIGKQTCGSGGIFDHEQYCGAKAERSPSP